MNFIQSTMSGKKAEKILLLILIARRYEIHSEKFKCLSLVRCWCVRVQRQWCVCVGVSVVIVIRALAGENIDVDIIASSFQLFSLSIPFEYLFVGVFIFSFRIVFSSFHFFRSRKNMSSICQFIKFDAAKSEKKKKQRNAMEKKRMWCEATANDVQCFSSYRSNGIRCLLKVKRSKCACWCLK